MKPIITCAASFFVGIFLASGWYQIYGRAQVPMNTHNRSSKSFSASAIAPKVRTDQHQPCQSDISLDAIRSIIRAENDLILQKLNSRISLVDSRTESMDTESAASANEAALENVSMEQTEAFDNSLAVIEDSRRAGVWDNHARDQFHVFLDKVNPAQREELILSVIRAVNNGEIDPQMDGPLF